MADKVANPTDFGRVGNEDGLVKIQMTMGRLTNLTQRQYLDSCLPHSQNSGGFRAVRGCQRLIKRFLLQMERFTGCAVYLSLQTLRMAFINGKIITEVLDMVM